MKKETPLFFTVCQSCSGEWGIHSFGGRNEREERKFARSFAQRVQTVTKHWDVAMASIKAVRAATPAAAN